MPILRQYDAVNYHRQHETDLRVLQDLHNLLNSKRDYASFIKEFGVDDVSSYSNREYISKVVIDEIARNIEQFMPTVELIEIFEKQGNAIDRINIEIRCRILGSTQEIQVITDMRTHSWEVQ